MHMAFPLPLPEHLRRAGWVVKIRDKERSEPPHVTVLRGTRRWRINLRTLRFMNKKPPPREVPLEIRRAINDEIGTLRRAWDRMYPHNVVGEIE